MRKSKINATKLEIIQVATAKFINEGYSKTSIRALCSELGIGLGHMTFYFPSKDDLLAVLVDMLCDFQWKLMKSEAEDGISQVLAVCLELMAMASATEENEIARDFFISSYTSPKTLEIIRKNDTQRAKVVFAEYCQGWSDEQFTQAEVLVSGIEYATFMTTETSSSLDVRISGALDAILTIYNVPQDIRQRKIEKVLSMDYRKIGRRIFDEFKEYIEAANEHTLEELLNK